MRIGILQCGQSPAQLKDEFGDYPDMFMRLLDAKGLSFQVWHVEAMEFPDDISACDGWLLTGSRHGAYEDHPFIPPLEALIRRVYAAHIPMVGICFGHQIIAQALGGKVIKHPQGWVVGSQDYDFAGQPVRLNAWHQDQVVAIPEGAKVVAHNAQCEHAALAYGDHVYTVQAHPEFSDQFVQGLMETRAKGVVPQPLLDQASERMGRPIDSALLANQIAEFFLNAHKTARGLHET